METSKEGKQEHILDWEAQDAHDREILNSCGGVVKVIYTPGYYLIQIVRSAQRFAGNGEQFEAIQRVVDLLIIHCLDGNQWSAAFDALQCMLGERPELDAPYDICSRVDPALLALAAARQAALVWLLRTSSLPHSTSELQNHVWRANKFLLCVLAQKPETGSEFVAWVDRFVEQPNA